MKALKPFQIVKGEARRTVSHMGLNEIGGFMRENNNQLNHSASTRARLQVIEPSKKLGRASSATGVNQHVKSCIHRLVFNSELQISSLRQVARLAGVTGPRSEAKVLDIIRETVREANRPLPPSGGAAQYRRAA